MVVGSSLGNIDQKKDPSGIGIAYFVYSEEITIQSIYEIPDVEEWLAG